MVLNSYSFDCRCQVLSISSLVFRRTNLSRSDNDFDHHEPYATVLKYSNKEMEIEYIENSEQIISKDELEILKRKLKGALYSSQPKYIPNGECKFCPCYKGCEKGKEYLKQISI